MYYIIDKDDLYDRIDEEVSRVADESYTENGQSTYDSIVLTSRDRNMVERFIDDAVTALVRRAFDICKYSPETTTDEFGEAQLTGRMRLFFYVPDLDETMEDTIKEEISRYITLYSSAMIFESRRVAAVPQYAERITASMDRAVALLKSRKSPTAIW